MRAMRFEAVVCGLWMLCVPIVGCQGAQRSVPASPQKVAEGDGQFHAFSLPGLNGAAVDFAAFKGKYVLLVNTASRCGFTPQYEALQTLHETHGDKVVHP